MKKPEITQEDLDTFDQFKQDNPLLFSDSTDYSKQIAKLKKDSPSDRDILSGKKLQDFYSRSYQRGGKEMSAEQAQNSKDYYQKVVQPGTKKPLTTEDAIKIIKTMVSTYEKNEQTTYQWDDSNKKVIWDLLRYFMNDHLGPLSTRKWIWLYGEMGRGKSFIANLFSDFTRAYGIKKRFEVVAAEDLAEQVKREKSIDSLNKYVDTICIDDAGQEDAVKVYGEKIDVIEHILRKAYNKYHRSRDNKPTIIITSNLAPDAMARKMREAQMRIYSIESRYKDERTIDRIYEMFNFVPLLGKNKRSL